MWKVAGYNPALSTDQILYDLQAGVTSQQGQPSWVYILTMGRGVYVTLNVVRLDIILG